MPCTTDDTMTLESFVLHAGNRLAYAATEAVIQSPAQAYNPLFIHGPVGVGKTHLLQAIGRTIGKLNTGRQVLYLTANELKSYFHARESLESALESCDVLLLDEVEQLTDAKERKHLLVLVRRMCSDFKQVVMASDAPPNDLSTDIENGRLNIRWGLVIPMILPDQHEPPEQTALDADDLWSNALSVIRSQLSKPVYDTWFHNSRAVMVDGCLTVYSPTRFACDWLEARYTQQILGTVQQLTGEVPSRVIFEADDSATSREVAANSRASTDQRPVHEPSSMPRFFQELKVFFKFHK
ncbi:DnaA ATPase domain-containing protein [Cohnella fermenti]|uniref:AAA family ATPase n=1 Tax=Cohnella fermenti TaxID=2565925 RepID=A0A4S4BFS7_9BACL|nr:DnaA/Hda family protein [Cohnella fermenti]THF73217.1 AAA family ATPase [Cohnella fermenti]